MSQYSLIVFFHQWKNCFQFLCAFWGWKITESCWLWIRCQCLACHQHIFHNCALHEPYSLPLWCNYYLFIAYGKQNCACHNLHSHYLLCMLEPCQVVGPFLFECLLSSSVCQRKTHHCPHKNQGPCFSFLPLVCSIWLTVGKIWYCHDWKHLKPQEKMVWVHFCHLRPEPLVFSIPSNNSPQKKMQAHQYLWMSL